MGKVIDATNFFRANRKKKNYGKNVSINEIRVFNVKLYEILDEIGFETIYEVLTCNPDDLRRIPEFTDELYGALLCILDIKEYNTDKLVSHCPYNLSDVMNYYLKYNDVYKR